MYKYKLLFGTIIESDQKSNKSCALNYNTINCSRIRQTRVLIVAATWTFLTFKQVADYLAAIDEADGGDKGEDGKGADHFGVGRHLIVNTAQDRAQPPVGFTRRKHVIFNHIQLGHIVTEHIVRLDVWFGLE